jgi:hypothetical protein
MPLVDKGAGSTGVGEAVSDLVQFNINDAPSGPCVVYVDEANPGICKATIITSGYSFINFGRFWIDPKDIFTTWRGPHGNPEPRRDLLRQHVKVDAELVDATTFVFQVSPSPLYIDIKGTINIQFAIPYRVNKGT